MSEKVGSTGLSARVLARYGIDAGMFEKMARCLAESFKDGWDESKSHDERAGAWEAAIGKKRMVAVIYGYEVSGEVERRAEEMVKEARS